MVAAVSLTSHLRLALLSGSRVEVVSRGHFIPSSRQGLTCRTTRLLGRQFRIGGNISVAVRGTVPITTKLTKNDDSTTTTLENLGGL